MEYLVIFRSLSIQLQIGRMIQGYISSSGNCVTNQGKGLCWEAVVSSFVLISTKIYQTCVPVTSSSPHPLFFPLLFNNSDDNHVSLHLLFI